MADQRAAISLATITTLAGSPNPSVSSAAIALMIGRIERSQDLMASVRADQKSDNPDLCRKATLARELLLDWSPDLIALSDSINGHVDGTAVVDRTLTPLDWTAEDLLATAGWNAVPRERPSPDDGEARRRRREVMVLHEGDGRIAEEDIIRPPGRNQSATL